MKKLIVSIVAILSIILNVSAQGRGRGHARGWKHQSYYGHPKHLRQTYITSYRAKNPHYKNGYYRHHRNGYYRSYRNGVVYRRYYTTPTHRYYVNPRGHRVYVY